jgi:hypothetical protein
MTIQEIKAELGVSSLELNIFKAEDGTVTDWYRQWKNEDRKAILMHADVLKKVQDNPEFTGLAIKSSSKETDKGPMTTAVIVAYTPAEVIL